MVKTKTTKLVKGSASSKELNMQLQRVQNREMEQSKTGSQNQQKLEGNQVPIGPRNLMNGLQRTWGMLLTCIGIPEHWDTRANL